MFFCIVLLIKRRQLRATKILQMEQQEKNKSKQKTLLSLFHKIGKNGKLFLSKKKKRMLHTSTTSQEENFKNKNCKNSSANHTNPEHQILIKVRNKTHSVHPDPRSSPATSLATMSPLL